jgi:uncharacterized protein (DUF58 family)
MNQILKRRATVFLISDFIAGGYEKDLQVANKRHDLVAIHLIDPAEEQLPGVGLVELADLESGEIALIDTASQAVREQYRQTAEKEKTALTRFFKKNGIDYVEIYTNQSYLLPLTRFFRMRARRFR